MGKSTLIDALGARLIEEHGHRVGVLTVDPSSTVTGGSILGDRTRMAALTARPEAFVRPAPAGTQLGGVARATSDSMRVLEAAGHDVVLIETVGVGQSEVAVAGMVDTFVVLQAARAGDQLQGIKRGILELADVIAVTKADGDGEQAARVAARELSIAMRLIASDDGSPTPVLTCSAHTGAGLDDLWAAVRAYHAALDADGGLKARRRTQQLDQVWILVDDELRRAVRTSPAVRAATADVEARVANGQLSAAEAADELLAAYHQAHSDGATPGPVRLP